MFYLDKSTLQDKPDLRRLGKGTDWGAEYAKRQKSARYPALKRFMPKEPSVVIRRSARLHWWR
ncbi:hypothetical protein P4S73_05210 [Paraglaciecola sp. Hal342]